MEALLAIAMLCNGLTGGFFGAKDATILKCQQDYIACYEQKLVTTTPPASEDPKVWLGKLKDCVKEK